MEGKITLTMFKPDAVRGGQTGEMLRRIERAGFRIAALRMVHLTKKEAERFYAVHLGKPFYEALTAYMSSGPIVAAILQKENAVENFRALIGATDPEKAAEGTLRRVFGKSIEANAIHGSDSDENALVECAFFFRSDERWL